MKSNLLQLRNLYGVTRPELSNALQISTIGIYAIENDRFDTSVPEARKISDFFNLSVDEVFLWEHEETRLFEKDPVVVAKVNGMERIPEPAPRKPWYSFFKKGR